LGFTPIVEKVYLPFLVPADSEKLLAENWELRISWVKSSP
jgi:hypothetical protein